MAKTKIELFEENLIAEGLNDDNLQEYEKLLRRAGNDWNRIQHCFITAYHFPVERTGDSVKLIEFGISKYGSKQEDIIPAYEMLGTIYERSGLYQKAYDLYVEIFPNIGNFRGSFPWCLLDTKIHVDNFKYSDDMKQYYDLCLKENDFSRSFLQHQFILKLAEYIIADHNNDLDDKSNAYDAINEMIEPEYRGLLYKHLKKHSYEEKLRISKECRKFLKCMKR